MKPNRPVFTHRTAVAVLMLAAFGFVVAGPLGCATTQGEHDPNGDLPWNTPADWEGTPSIPGLSGYE